MNERGLTPVDTPASVTTGAVVMETTSPAAVARAGQPWTNPLPPTNNTFSLQAGYLRLGSCYLPALAPAEGAHEASPC